MDMTGEYRIPAPREKVWQALNDAEILKQCIPGCDELVKDSDTEMRAKVSARVGPVSAKFAGKVTLSDIKPPESYTISGEGTGGVAGFAKGGASVALREEDGVTVLSYTAKATVGGKLAQIGSRLIDSTARKMADDFFGKFASVVGEAVPAAVAPPAPPTEAPAPAAPEAKPAAPPPAPEPGKGLSPLVWVGGLVVIVVILLVLFTRG
jgi:carbon monoxide dehydrogenase subunit G